MATTFSFDIVSDFDKGEMNNVLDQVRREVITRYDLKGTASAIDWLDADKSGFRITGDNQFHLEAIMDMIRRRSALRGISQKTFDTSAEPVSANMKTSWDVTFKKGLDQEKAKRITSLLRDFNPKIKAQIQGEEVRVTSSKKDELQGAIDALKSADFDFPVIFTNYR